MPDAQIPLDLSCRRPSLYNQVSATILEQKIAATCQSLLPTCLQLVCNLSLTCWKHVKSWSENLFCACFMQDLFNGIWP